MSGNGPPPNVSSIDLWTRLTQSPRPWRDVTFPRRGVDIAVRVVVLTERELMTCRADAEKYARGLTKDTTGQGYREIYNNELVVQMICTAYRDPAGDSLQSRAFPSPDLARSEFTSDEFTLLFNAYCDWQTESGPLISSMTKEDMDAYLDVLAEGASRDPLARLSSAARDELLMHSASERRRSREANTSHGSPPNAS